MSNFRLSAGQKSFFIFNIQLINRVYKNRLATLCYTLFPSDFVTFDPAHEMIMRSGVLISLEAMHPRAVPMAAGGFSFEKLALPPTLSLGDTDNLDLWIRI
jgi:hypothetical protein